jgi:hypothetical protein
MFQLKWLAIIRPNYKANKTGILRITQQWGTFLQPLSQWKSNKYYIFWVFICSLRYLACNAHAPHHHLWPARLYNVFPYYFINSTIFEKKNYWNKNLCFDFSTTLVLNSSLSEKKWARYDKKFILVFM